MKNELRVHGHLSMLQIIVRFPSSLTILSYAGSNERDIYTLPMWRDLDVLGQESHGLFGRLRS
jgi:hypothetical protein